MIIGKLTELHHYKGLTKNLDAAIDFALKNDLLEFPIGKTPIDGDKLFLMREDYFPRPLEDCFLEGHQNYIDLQIVVAGLEGFGYSSRSNGSLSVKEEYKPDKDMDKFTGNSETIYELGNNSFAICFPWDLHMPKIRLSHSKDTKKAILKVKVE